jgi:hypothetical protein
MAEEVNEFYWERIRGFISENDVDARWILRKHDDNKAHGSLRIVSHPDLKYGYLRAFWTLVTKRRPKTEEEILKTVEELQMDIKELELYSVDEHIETTSRIIEEPLRKLEELFGVDIFE